MENSHNIEIIHERLSSCVDSIKMTVKHYQMMNNQAEQMISLQNKLYEKLLAEKRQVCGFNTRGGSSTQDPDYPEGHPKRKEQEARKKKSFAGESPNESEENENSKDQDNDISISDAETEDDNNEEGVEMSQPREEPPEDDANKEPELIINEDPQSSKEKSKKKKIPPQPKGKERDPWVHRPIPYPQEVMKTLDNERFEKFIELIKSLYLQIPLLMLLRFLHILNI